MIKCYADLHEAAADASREFAIPISRSDLLSLVRLGVLPALPPVKRKEPVLRVEDVGRLAGSVRIQREPAGLFGSLSPWLSDEGDAADLAPGESDDWPLRTLTGTVSVKLAPGIVVSYVPSSIDSEKIQMFMLLIRDWLREAAPLPADEEHTPPMMGPVDVDAAVTVWTSRSVDEAVLRGLWAKAVCPEATTSFTQSLTVASIYGCKARMTAFLVAVARRHLPEHAAVLDLMSGSGVVARQLSTHFHVYANDANPFAALLTRSAGLSMRQDEVENLAASIVPAYTRNHKAIARLLSEALEEEAVFLHGEVTRQALVRYRAFCSREAWVQAGSHADALRPEGGTYGELPGAERLAQMVDQRRGKPDLFPYCLATAYFSNAYLGLEQSIVADSLRYAIDQCATGESRDLSLAALLLAVCSCGSSPHFAQPPMLKSQRSMREVVEHRASDMLNAFTISLRLLAENPERNGRLRTVWNADWREALVLFDAAKRDSYVGVRAVYVDPPYTKLQYSRYYHVLNTLLNYKYYVSTGKGRYPPTSERFSSKFEYQRSSAAREFEDLLQQCSALGLITLLSYSDKGLVPIRQLAEIVSRYYRHLEIYSKPARHHSQGTRLRGRQQVTEYVLVGF